MNKAFPTHPRTAARLGILLLLLASAGLAAAGGPSAGEKIQKFFSGIGRGISAVGDKASQLIPGLNKGKKTKADFGFSRDFEERYPVSDHALLFITNEFGAIQIETWEESSIQVNAEIVVGAKSSKIAKRVSNAIEIGIIKRKSRLEVRTALPDTSNEKGLVTIEVNYEVKVPSAASVTVSNRWGDTLLEGIEGAIALDAHFGAVGISDCLGPANVRTHGDFPLKVDGLARGGAFELHGANAEFASVGGTLRVHSFRGSVLLGALGEKTDIEITSENGPITLEVPDGTRPDLVATAVFGAITGDYPLSHNNLGGNAAAQSVQTESKQRIRLSATFADIQINHESAAPPAEAAPPGAGQPFKDVLTHEVQPKPGATLTLDAARGSIMVRGVEGGELRITATKIVTVLQAEQAPAALEALRVEVTPSEDGYHVRTQAPEDMEALGCSDYRIDLRIECPETLALNISALDGNTVVRNMKAPLTIQQTAGNIEIQDVRDTAVLSNKAGNVTAIACKGPIEVKAEQGAVTLKRITEAIQSTCLNGRTVVEAAKGPVRIENKGGDVRVLALQGIGGEYDIRVEKGNLSMALASESHAMIEVEAHEGVVRNNSAIELNGSLSKDVWIFHGRLNKGTHRLRLESRQGDIFLD